jgi:hypothetical protein
LKGEKDMQIAQALLRIESENELDKSLPRLGSYLTESTAVPIADYKNYIYESADYTLPYNGRLNRSKGVYELDIAAFVQNLIKNPTKNVIMLGPDATDTFNFGETALTGPISVSLTYTLID